MVTTSAQQGVRTTPVTGWGIEQPEYDARVIVSGATLAKAKGKYRTRRLGEVSVKGKQIQTEIFALLG